ncbi:MAG: ATP-binding protein [Treponema sp.]|nr:ATP-binding protein [Treponema sp.]
MGNVILNELKIRGFDVDVGVVEQNSRDESGRSKRNYLAVDFVANWGDKRFYIKSALSIDDAEKRAQETNSLSRINDSFRKIVVVKGDIEPWQDDNGIQYIGVEQSLLDEELLR